MRPVGAGDVNGVGVGDIVVGAPGADHNLLDNSGSADVLRGKRGGRDHLVPGAGKRDLAAVDAGDRATASCERVKGP